VTLILGLLLIGAVGFQWLTQEVTVKLWGPAQFGFHRDEWPAFYWGILALELGLGALCIYLFFA
jgi:hypothetical protein